MTMPAYALAALKIRDEPVRLYFCVAFPMTPAVTHVEVRMLKKVGN